MQSNKERDKLIKEKLLGKFGTSEFKAQWDELADLLDLDLPKTKYHIFKLEAQGFLKVIAKSTRGGGYTSPNVIQIFSDGEQSETVEPENVVMDIKKYIAALEKKVQRTEALENEVRRLTRVLADAEASNKRLLNDLVAIRNNRYDK